MKPLLDDMLLDRLIRIDERQQGVYTERRPVALVDPTLRYFSADDVTFLDNAVENFQSHTGREVSASSHGVAWLTRKDGDPMPYDLALLSDARMTEAEEQKFLSLGEGRLWRTN
jgi:hypothetical protein